MSDFKLFHKLTRWDQNNDITGLYISKPEIIGFVENDGNQLKFADRMRYFKLPKSNDYPLDLNAGYEKYRHRPKGFFNNKLNKVEFYLMNKYDCNDENVDDADNVSGQRKYEVVTHRGVLSTLMETPYQLKINNAYPVKWKIFATQYKNKLYLIGERENERNENEEILNKNSTHHFKFEQYCFTDDPLREPDTSAAVDESQQIYCIYRTKLKNLNLMYSAEINGIISDEKLQDLRDIQEVGRCRFVHTKLMKANNPYWMKNYRILGWWCKAYLAVVNDIYVGFKTEEALVRQPVQHLFVNKCPQEQRWSPKVCNQFVHTFITKILTTMRGVDCPYTCYEFAFDSRKACIEFRIHSGKTQNSFLGEDFVEYAMHEIY